MLSITNEKEALEAVRQNDDALSFVPKGLHKEVRAALKADK